MHEGQCVQIMHKGSPEHTSDITAKIYQEYLPANKLVPSGQYHEIYLTFSKRVAAEKMATIIRKPVA